MDGARIVVLYHKENAQLPLVIHDIFGGAPEWLELDLASVDVHRTIMRLRAFVRAPDRDPSPVPMPMPVLLRHGNHRSGKKLIAALCTWSSKRLRVVIHCTEFVRGSFFSMTCNMDHIVAEKRGRRLLWPRCSRSSTTKPCAPRAASSGSTCRGGPSRSTDNLFSRGRGGEAGLRARLSPADPEQKLDQNRGGGSGQGCSPHGPGTPASTPRTPGRPGGLGDGELGVRLRGDGRPPRVPALRARERVSVRRVHVPVGAAAHPRRARLRPAPAAAAGRAGSGIGGEV